MGEPLDAKLGIQSTTLRRGPTALALRLAKIIKDEAGIEVEPVIRRTFAGRHQRAAGAFSWWMWYARAIGPAIGSQHPATRIATAKGRDYSQVNYGDVQVDPRD
jgi:hypothetical protein